MNPCPGRSILYHSWTLCGSGVRQKRTDLTHFFLGLVAYPSSEGIYINGLLPTFENNFTCSWLLIWFLYRLWGPLSPRTPQDVHHGREAKQLFSFILSLDSDLDISETRIKCKKRWTSGEEMGLGHSIRIAFSSILYSLQELNRLAVKGFSILFSSSVIIQLLLCNLFRKVCIIKSIFGIIIY